MSDRSQDHTPIISEFANDPEMRELVEMFTQDMPGKIASFEGAMASHRLDELRRLAHQLKGAAGGYGFGVVGEAADRLEQHLMNAPSAAVPSASFLEQVDRDVQELLNLCRSVRSGP